MTTGLMCTLRQLSTSLLLIDPKNFFPLTFQEPLISRVSVLSLKVVDSVKCWEPESLYSTERQREGHGEE